MCYFLSSLCHLEFVKHRKTSQNFKNAPGTLKTRPLYSLELDWSINKVYSKARNPFFAAFDLILEWEILIFWIDEGWKYETYK